MADTPIMQLEEIEITDNEALDKIDWYGLQLIEHMADILDETLQGTGAGDRSAWDSARLEIIVLRNLIAKTRATFLRLVDEGRGRIPIELEPLKPMEAL